MSIGGIFRHTLPMLLQAGVIRLFDEMDATSISAPCDKPALLRSVSRLLCDPNFNWLEYEVPELPFLLVLECYGTVPANNLHGRNLGHRSV